MAKTIAKILGAVLILVGVLGFTTVLAPLGAHLNPAHNAVHILTGVISLYFGFAASLSAARTFCMIFGAVYLLLGVVGYLVGDAGNMHMLHVGPLELGNTDHILHVLVGALYLIGGFTTGRDV